MEILVTEMDLYLVCHYSYFLNYILFIIHKLLFLHKMMHIILK
jgi:hypothetical protein